MRRENVQLGSTPKIEAQLREFSHRDDGKRERGPLGLPRITDHSCVKYGTLAR